MAAKEENDSDPFEELDDELEEIITSESDTEQYAGIKQCAGIKKKPRPHDSPSKITHVKHKMKNTNRKKINLKTIDEIKEIDDDDDFSKDNDVNTNKKNHLIIKGKDTNTNNINVNVDDEEESDNERDQNVLSILEEVKIIHNDVDKNIKQAQECLNNARKLNKKIETKIESLKRKRHTGNESRSTKKRRLCK